jgi:hypothetical protein
MKQGVVIGAYHGNSEALNRLLLSLEASKYPVWIVVSGAGQAPLEFMSNLYYIATEFDWHVLFNTEDRFELGAFRKVLDETDLEEFLFLQDTFEIKDIRVLDLIFKSKSSVALGPGLFHYAGKWKRSVLEKLEPLPVVHTKKESVHWEHTLGRRYWIAAEQTDEGIFCLDPNFHDGNHKGFVEAYGRKNMLLENDWYRKLKADWGQRPL